MNKSSGWTARQGTSYDSKGSVLQWLNYGKKMKPTDELIEISDQSIEVAKELIKEIERLHDSGKTREANRLITIARQMLHNNQKLQEVVGRIQAEAS